MYTYNHLTTNNTIRNVNKHCSTSFVW